MSINTIINVLEYVVGLRKNNVPKNEAIKAASVQFGMSAAAIRRLM